MTAPGPLSPCIDICQLDERDICRGCFRSLAEIGAWTSMTAAQQWQVVDRAEQRRQLALKSVRESAS